MGEGMFLFLKIVVLLTLLFWGVWTLSAVAVAAVRSLAPRDTTDDPKGARSGLRLYTDHHTGIQYVGTEGGGLTPRLSPNGVPMRAPIEGEIVTEKAVIS